ncbi:MAG TPA: AtpZ/AtpI family protein [Acidimicrobiia bacterium]|nr:AtpZ/AtpI family protein [Acidimicrobiia bacterium]
MNQDTPTEHVHSTAHGWMQGSSFFSSILAGTTLGYLADIWLDTAPWLVVTGVVLGCYAGFLHVWRWAKEVEDAPRRP